jgi:Ca2+/Na+ antiporter
MKRPLGTAGRAAYLAAALVLSLAGVAGFIYLFALDFNVYWLILSPIIVALYQLPAVFVFWLYKRRTRAEEDDPGSGSPPTCGGEEREGGNDGPAAPRDSQP